MHDIKNSLFNFKQAFILESICMHYEDLQKKFMEYTSTTRSKIYQKDHIFNDVKYFNLMPNNLKTLTNSKKILSRK